jgi:hypothetical protein
VANRSRELNPDNLPRASTFTVGQAVRVAKRMMAGENKEGGQALVTAVSFSGDSAMYDVKYLLSTGSEKNLPEGLLSVPEVVPRRASSVASSSSSVASSSSSSSSEARRDEGLQRMLEETTRRYEQQIKNLQWQNRQQRAVAVRLNERQKEASRRLAAAGKALVAASEEAERQRVLRQFDLRVLNDRVEEMVKETEEVCSQQREEELAEMLKEHRLEEKRLKKVNAAAEKERSLASQRATAEHARLLSNVEELLAETGDAVEERVREEMGKVVETAEQRVAVLEEAQGDHSLMGLCRSILAAEELAVVQKMPFNLNTIVESDDVDALQSRRKSALGNVVGKLVGAVLTAAHPTDQAGVLNAATSRRDYASTVAGAALLAAGGGGRERKSAGCGGGSNEKGVSGTSSDCSDGGVEEGGLRQKKTSGRAGSVFVRSTRPRIRAPATSATRRGSSLTTFSWPLTFFPIGR